MSRSPSNVTPPSSAAARMSDITLRTAVCRTIEDRDANGQVVCGTPLKEKKTKAVSGVLKRNRLRSLSCGAERKCRIG